MDPFWTPDPLRPLIMGNCRWLFSMYPSVLSQTPLIYAYELGHDKHNTCFSVL